MPCPTDIAGAPPWPGTRGVRDPGLCRAVGGAEVPPPLGDATTLVTHAASVSHRTLSDEQLARARIGEGLIRVSAGIEDADDLWADFQQALDAAQ